MNPPTQASKSLHTPAMYLSNSGLVRERAPRISEDQEQYAVVRDAFARVLRQYRYDRHLSQEEVALRSELGREYISMLERQQRAPSLHAAYKLCQALNIRMVDFISAMETEIAELNKSRASRA